VLGERGDIPEEVQEHFVATGTAHLLAISGDQFGIVALLSFSSLLWILKRSEYLLLSISVKKWAAALTIPWVLLYTLIAGGGISVIRAAIMVIVFFVSILFDRERNLLHTLVLAAFLILIFSPPSLFDVSFQLSFLAVLSILYMVPRIISAFRQENALSPKKALWKNTLWKYARLSLLATLVATLGTAPFVALHFNRISLIGFVTNLVIIPWVGFFIVPLVLTASLFSFFITPLASLLIHLAGFITGLLLQGVALFASFPFASLYVSTPTVFEMILFYLLLFLAVHLGKGWVLRWVFLGLCLLLIGDIAFWNVRDRFEKHLTVTFLDVGQGDSILVEFPQGERMLIDGGGLREDRFDIGKNVIAPFLWGKKIRRIDTLVLTHPDPDHILGLNFIASTFSIGQFWHNGLPTDSEACLRLEHTLSKRKIERLALNDGISLPSIHGVQVSVFNPPAEIERIKGRMPPSLNNHSLVLKLQFKNVSVLLAGDIEKEAEYRMLGQIIHSRQIF
jgi:competence protein ComEC